MSTAHDDVEENSATDDSDPEPDSADPEIHYLPISAHPDSDSDSESESDIATEPAFPILSNGNHQNPNPNPNPSFVRLHAEDGISSLNLNGGLEEEEEYAMERERAREASILRAFREDESRRSAPLTAENASRVMDAMRGVQFPGFSPDWADRVPEERWVDRLRRLRGEVTPQS